MANEISEEIKRLRDTMRDIFGYGSDSLRYKIDELIDEIKQLRMELQKIRETLDEMQR